MGILEAELKKNLRRTKITKIILLTIGVAGILSVALVAPNMLQVLKMFESKKKYKTKPNYRIQTALSRLIDGGSIRKVDHGGQLYFELTDKGRKKLEGLSRFHSLLKKPKQWDGKWRIVSFDIHEKRRGVRDKLRQTLKSVGFLQLHQSMWIYPYDCEDLISLLKTDLQVGKNVLYIIADKVESDKDIKRRFALP